MATIKPKQQIAKNLKQWIRKTPATKRIEPLEFHNACYNLKVDIELATEGLGEVQFFLRENGQSNKADAIEKLYNQLLSSVSTEYHKRSDGHMPMYLELESAKKNASLLLAGLEKIKPAETEQDTAPSKEEVEKAKPTTSPAGLLNDLNFVLDDIERLEGSRRFNPYVDKYIRTELATAYHETKKAVEKIRAQNPAIKETPADSNDPRKYLRNVHTWCVGQLFWENGERIGETPAETGGDTTPAKRCGVWTLVKRIPRWIYVLVIFLAALIYILRWLWTIFWPK